MAAPRTPPKDPPQPRPKALPPKVGPASAPAGPLSGVRLLRPKRLAHPPVRAEPASGSAPPSTKVIGRAARPPVRAEPAIGKAGPRAKVIGLAAHPPVRAEAATGKAKPRAKVIGRGAASSTAAPSTGAIGRAAASSTAPSTKAIGQAAASSTAPAGKRPQHEASRSKATPAKAAARGTVALDIPEVSERDSVEEVGVEEEERSGWSWKIGWLGVVAPAMAAHVLRPEHALPSLHGLLAMGTHCINRHAMRERGAFPEGLIAAGDGSHTIIWGNPMIVERFADTVETVINLDFSSALAGVNVHVLQTTVRFHPGNVYSQDLGQDLKVAVIIPVPANAYSVGAENPWEEMNARGDWCESASSRSCEILRKGTRLIFGSFGLGHLGFSENVALALGHHCCCLAEGPRDAGGANTAGSAVWMVGAHTRVQGPANRGGDPMHEWLDEGSDSAPAGRLPLHGKPLRVTMFRVYRDSVDLTTCPVVYLGQGRRQRERTSERKRAKLRHYPASSRPGGSAGSAGVA